MSERKNLAVLVHYDRDDQIADYVVAYAQALRAEVDELIFVSTAKLNQKEQAKLKAYAKKIIVRENVGYDFMSWQVGLQAAGDPSRYDEVIIANDSCYAPLFPFAEMFAAMHEVACDFWGVTASHEIDFHLQSYFMVFGPKVLASSAFKQFWQGVQPQADKMEVVRKYEVGLSRQLITAGFKPATYFDLPRKGQPTLKIKQNELTTFIRTMAREIVQRPGHVVRKLLDAKNTLRNRKNIWRRNPSLYGYRQGLLLRVPFFKVMLIRDNIYPQQTQAGYLREIAAHSDYNVDLIRQHLKI